MRITPLLACLFLLLPACVHGTPTPARPAGVPEAFVHVYAQDFTDAAPLDDFRVTQPDAFRHRVLDDGTGVFECDGPRDAYEPAVRSPYYIALLRDARVGSFVLDVWLEQTSREYGHRDACFFYGFQDPTHFYYTHIATAQDPNAHKHFIVNGEPRAPFSDVFTDGYDWGTGVRHIRIVRDIDTGLTQAFVDDADEPIIIGTDTTFGVGYVGVGTFDDAWQVHRLELWADPTTIDRARTEVFFAPIREAT